MAAAGTLSAHSGFLNGYSSGHSTPGSYRADPEQMDGTDGYSPDDNPKKSIIQVKFIEFVLCILTIECMLCTFFVHYLMY